MSYTAKAYYRHEHDDNPVDVTNDDDIRTLIQAMLTEPPSNSLVALYVNERPLTEWGMPDHELRIGIDASHKVGAIRYTSGVDAWYAVGALRGEDDVRYHYMGNEDPFPPDSRVDLDTVLAVTSDFLAKGASGRPEGVQWAEWPASL